MPQERIYRVPNTTQFPNEIMDELMPALSGAEFKVLCYIARRTFGFGKVEDSISLKQICKGIVRRDGKRLDGGTGLSRSTAKLAVKSLETRALIHVERSAIKGSDESDVNCYSITVEVEPGPVKSGLPEGGPKIGLPQANEVGRKSAHGRAETGLPGGPKIGPTKESITKESLHSSSSTPPSRKPPRREEEDFTGVELQAITRAIDTYAPADPAIASKVASLVKAAAPEIEAAGIVVLIHCGVPKDLPVKSAGYWLTALPKLFGSSHWKHLWPLLRPSNPWHEKWTWAANCLRHAEKSDPNRRYAELWRQYWDHEGDPTRQSGQAQDTG